MAKEKDLKNDVEEIEEKIVDDVEEIKNKIVGVADKAVMYIGPTVINRGLIENRVYRDGIPDHIKDLVSKYPVLNMLFAPIEKVHDYTVAKSKSGTPQNIAVKLLKGRGDK